MTFKAYSTLMLSSCQRFYRIIQFQMFTIFVAMLFLPLFNSKAPTLDNFSISNIYSHMKKEKNGLTAHFQFNLTYNITNQISWNIKEIYVAVIASWENQAGIQEQIIWDKVIFHKDFSSFIFNGSEKSKYAIEPIEGQQIAGESINFSFYIYKISFGGLFNQYKIPAEIPAVVLTK